MKDAEYQTGSRMLAYDRVGRAIGKSPSWVRKLVGRHTVGLQHFEFLNIMRVYETLCARVGEVADRWEAAAEANERQADAAGAGALPGVAGLAKEVGK